jgi:uncharacterized protein with ParB-like and HNH nuclease domain
MEQTVALIDLFGMDFIIPHYQRGYRWEAQEVEELLDDLWNFEKTSNKGEFYCLQPIVLQKNNGNVNHVLDGQQRLTTLYLIITFLEEIRNDSGYNQTLFTLNYETRRDCHTFLKDKKFISGIDETNIDYFHITKAYQTIKNWFANTKHAGAKMKLVPVLMDKNDKGNRNVRFIWYEAENNVNPIEIFIRLNVGKIPLTDAELTKALLLQSDKYDKDELKFIKMRLFEIATEWDTIEYTLRNDEFWYFLCNQSNDKPTYIEFIFDLIADNLQREKKYFEKKPLKHATFLILSEYLQDLLDNEKCTRIDAVEKIWEQVTEYFEYFRNWFQNRTIFHYIGYLIALKGNQIIDSLILQSKISSKKQFNVYLESEIGKLIVVHKKRKDSDGNEYEVTLDNLNYENEDQKTNDRGEINRILLLHNVYTSLKSDKEKACFPFNLYKQTKRNEKWSLEHIHAQNSEYIIKKENQLTWLNDHIKSFTNQNNPVFAELINRMETLRDADEIEKEAFETLTDDVYATIKEFSDADEKNIHSISNLCLVDSNTNSRLNNSVFDVKREIIKERELKGHYIPICTRNVFMKSYTKYPANNAYWTENDRKGYLESIKQTYSHFINSIVSIKD